MEMKVIVKVNHKPDFNGWLVCATDGKYEYAKLYQGLSAVKQKKEYFEKDARIAFSNRGYENLEFIWEK